MSAYPRYPAYKPSGVDWLGEIPTHWEVNRNKRIFQEVNERSETGSEELLSVSHITGVTRRSQKEVNMFLAESLEGYKLCQPGDLVINTMWAWMGALGITKEHGIVSPSYHVYRQNRIYHSDYFDYVCRISTHINEVTRYSKGIWSSRLRLYPDGFFEINSPVPPIEEQRAIVGFLDGQTAVIDTLIAEKQALIDLLHEKRNALISHAVTKGLNPHTPMKDSGIPWLGQIPTHWELTRFKFLTSDGISGPYGSSLTKAMYVGEGYRVYGQQQVIPNNFEIGDYYISPEKYEEMRRYTVNPGDILISVMGTVGRAAIVPIGVEPGIINPRLVKYRAKNNLAIPQFLQISIQSEFGENQLKLASQGSTMAGLNMQILGELLIALPPVEEQEQIINHVKSSMKKFDELITEVEAGIATLQEYRTALISAAVTGQIDVRHL